MGRKKSDQSENPVDPKPTVQVQPDSVTAEKKELKKECEKPMSSHPKFAKFKTYGGK